MIDLRAVAIDICHISRGTDTTQGEFDRVSKIESILREVVAGAEGYSRMLVDWDARVKQERHFTLEQAAKCLPISWLDPLLSGNKSIPIPWNCSEVEAYTKALAERIRALKP